MDKACLSSSLCAVATKNLRRCKTAGLSLLSAGRLSTQVVLEFKRGVSLALYGPSVPLAACHCKTVTRGSPPPGPRAALQSWEAQQPPGQVQKAIYKEAVCPRDDWVPGEKI